MNALKKDFYRNSQNSINTINKKKKKKKFCFQNDRKTSNFLSN